MGLLKIAAISMAVTVTLAVGGIILVAKCMNAWADFLIPPKR